MLCKKCGFTLSLEAKFCDRCGMEAPPEIAAEENRRTPTAKEEKKRRALPIDSKFLIAVLATVAMIALYQMRWFTISMSSISPLNLWIAAYFLKSPLTGFIDTGHLYLITITIQLICYLNIALLLWLCIALARRRSCYKKLVAIISSLAILISVGALAVNQYIQQTSQMFLIRAISIHPTPYLMIATSLLVAVLLLFNKKSSRKN